MNSSGSTAAIVTSPTATMRTFDTPPVSTAIAPTHVGALCSPTGSARPSASI